MDISDFEGNFGYKLVIPIIYVLNWIAMFLGPSLFPVAYQRYSIVCWIYGFWKVLLLDINIIASLYKTYRTLSRANIITPSDPIDTTSNKVVVPPTNRIYAFVIPSYREDIDLLSDTLRWLACHPRATTNYVICLAMEMHEDGSDIKAGQLIDRFRDHFRMMTYTRHVVREHEQKGKASNVSWCVEHLGPVFAQNGIRDEQVMLTIIDADSWVPPAYIDNIQQHLVQNTHNMYRTVFAPPQIFTRNHLEVPVFTRIYDSLHSLAHTSQLNSCFDLSYPLSNYTVSYCLMKKVGYWDTCADAIGEDFHTTFKILWKTRGDFTCVPIYTAFNQVNVETGNGYLADVEARFWQAERHSQGVSDVAYNMKMLFKTKYFSLRSLIQVFYVLEVFALPATLPWVGMSYLYQSQILYRLTKPSPELFSQFSVQIIFNACTVATLLLWIIYEITKRYSNSKLYRHENDSVLRLLEYPLVVGFNVTLMAIPTFVIAAFSSLMKAKAYRVAEKNLKKTNI